MERQEIKANYHKFLASYRYMYSDEEIMNQPEIKKRYDEVFEELMDTYRKSIGRLTDYDTEEVRRVIGVYAEEEGFEEPSLLVSLNSSAAAITTRIKHGYIVVKDALLSGKLTYKQLFKLKVIEMDYPLNETNHVWLLHENGLVTVRDYLESYSFGLSIRESLVEYLHSFGLTFREEKVNQQIQQELKDLMSKFDDATKKVDKYNENIKEEKDKIKELQNAKKLLLNKMQYLAEGNKKKIR